MSGGVADISYMYRTLYISAHIGDFFIIGGAKWPYRNVETKSLTRAGWVLMTIVALAAAAGFFWFDRQFTALGYHVG